MSLPIADVQNLAQSSNDAIAVEPLSTVSSGEGLGNQELSDLSGISVSTIEKWKAKLKKGEAIAPRGKHADFFSRWELGKGGLWYPRQ